MKRIISSLSLLCTLCFLSCQKEAGSDITTDPSASTALPLSISIEDPEFQEVEKFSFKYLQSGNTIEIYADDIATANPYDQLVQSNFYNSAGYFTKREFYSDGIIVESMQVERAPDNTIMRVTSLVNYPEDLEVSKDTFDVSFYDSASLRVMKVDYPVRFPGDEIQTSRRFIFSNKSRVKNLGGTFYGQQNWVTWGKEEFTYDGQKRLLTHTDDGYYGRAFAYEQEGSSLDSFYLALGGVDGYLLDAPGHWGTFAHEEFTFYPLKLILFNSSVELEVNMHRFGVIREVRSIPNGTDYPNTAIFTFENVLDQQKRVRQTTIRSKDEVEAIWKIEYPEK